MEQPIPGYYRWIGERTLELDYMEALTAIKQGYTDAGTASKPRKRRERTPSKRGDSRLRPDGA